jgi:peptide/nickel transport system substrate-binding protein
MIVYNLGETLYTYKLGTTELIPQLASALPQVSPDGLTYTIPLRRGIKFHDGTAFNAQAMAFSLERFIKNGGEPSFLLSGTIDSIQVSNEYVLKIKLKQPFAAFPALLAFPGVCAVSPQAYQIGEGKFKPDDFVGTGPYRLVSQKSDTIKLESFPDYWGEKPKNKGIDLQIYLDNSANLFNAFRTQAVDVAYQSLQPQQVKKLKEGAAQGKWQVIEAPSTAISYLALNIQSNPLQLPALRQAVAMLVDRQFLTERILQGQGEPLYSLIPNTLDVYEPVFKERYGERNITKAKEILTKLGYSPELPLRVEIWHSSRSISGSMLASVLKALAKRDLDGIIQFEPNSIASAAYFKNVGKGLYESSFANWYADFLDADNYTYPFLACAKGSRPLGCQEGGSQSQGSFYYNERMNELIAQQRQEQNTERRREIFREIQNLLAKDVPYIPLWQSKDYAFAQKGIQGVIINPSQTFPFWTIY